MPWKSFQQSIHPPTTVAFRPPSVPNNTGYIKGDRVNRTTTSIDADVSLLVQPINYLCVSFASIPGLVPKSTRQVPKTGKAAAEGTGAVRNSVVQWDDA